MRFFLDTEFNEDGRTVELISIALVAEDGREFEWVSSEFDEAKCNDFVKTNVLPHLPPRERRVARATIASDIRAIVLADGQKPEFWGYCADYDWVVLCQLYGRMVDLPKGFPYWCRDLKQMMVELGYEKGDLPRQSAALHRALHDARWEREAWLFMQEKRILIEREVAEVKRGYHKLDENWEKHHDACMNPIREAVGDQDATVPEIVSDILRQNRLVATLFGERKCAHCGKSPTCFGAYEDLEYAYACDECCAHGCEDGRCVPVVDVDDTRLVARIAPHMKTIKSCVYYTMKHGHVAKDSEDAEQVRNAHAALLGIR